MTLQAFKPAQTVKVKVVGARPMDGLAVLSAKPSVVEAAAAPAPALAAGQVVTGRVASIDDKGAVLTLSPGIRCVRVYRRLFDALRPTHCTANFQLRLTPPSSCASSACPASWYLTSAEHSFRWRT